MSTDQREPRWLSRRAFLQTGAAATAGLWLAACTLEGPDPNNGTMATPSEVEPETATQAATEAVAAADTPTLAPTPRCEDGDETLAQTEGPFYTPDTPQRTNLVEEGMSGARLRLRGQVLSTACIPIAGAVLDFWQADDRGQYDNTGYRLRGHQFTAEDGSYVLETIVPGLYPGRTRHIHVKVQGPETGLLTTQLYFPDEPRNQADGIFHPALVVTMTENGDGQSAAFDFVLA